MAVSSIGMMASTMIPFTALDSNINLLDDTYIEQFVNPETLGVSFENDGVFSTIQTIPETPADQWYIGRPVASIGDGVEVQLFSTSGDAPETGAAVGVWQTITTARQWTFSTDGVVGKNGVWTFRIRNLGAESFVEADLTMILTAL